MRIRAGLFVVLAALVLAPGAASSQATLGPLLAYHDDVDFGIGVALGLPVTSIEPGAGLLADFVWFFPEGTGTDYWEINGNATYDFPLQNSTVLPFVLAGLNIGHFSIDTGTISGGDTELGLNLGGGIEFDAGSFRPSAGLRVTLGGYEGFVLFITLPFELGGA